MITSIKRSFYSILAFLLYILYCILLHNNITVVSFSALVDVKMSDCLINKCLMQSNV